MARQAITLAGAFIGAAYGAPQLGFFIGSLVGNAVDPQRIKAPSIGDIAQQTSAEGIPCPLYAGTAGGAGNLVYASEPDIVDGGTSSGKGGPEVENPDRAYVTFVIRIGASLFDGPGYRVGITGLRKVWEDEKLVYDVSPTSTILEESAKYAEGFSFYPGDHTQLPDPDLEAIEGVGNVPAYRGRAIFVKKRHDVTDRRGSIPSYRFEVTVNGAEVQNVALMTDVRTYGGARSALVPASADVGWPSNYDMVAIHPAGTHAVAALHDSVGTGFVFRKYDATTETWTSLTAPAVNNGRIVGMAWSQTHLAVCRNYNDSRRLTVYRLTGDTLSDITPPDGIGDVTLAHVAWLSDGSRLYGARGNSAVQFFLADFNDETDVFQPAVLFGQSGDGAGVFVSPMPAGGRYLAAVSRIDADTGALSVYDISGTPSKAAGTTMDNCFAAHWGSAFDNIVTVGNVGTDLLRLFEFNSSVIGAETLTLLAASITQPANDPIDRTTASAASLDNKFLALATNVDGFPLIYDLRTPGTLPRLSDPATTGSTVAAVGWTLAPDIPQLESGTTTFEQVVLATGRRCRIPDSKWNLPGLSAKVIRGTVAASQGYTAQDFLNALRVLYPCDGSCHDGKIHILLRGGAVDVELDEQFMVDEDSDLEQEEVLRNGDDKRFAPLRRPARLNLMFPNANVGYTLTKANPPNYGDRGEAVSETSIQVPAVLDEETEAPQLADILDKVGRADAEGEFVRVFPEYLAAKLVTGSVVRLTGGDLVRRMRVETLRRGDGTVRMGLRIDRTHALTSQATAQPSPGWPAPPPSLAGETVFEVLNSPGIIDGDDRVGVRMAFSGRAGTAWRGARVDYRVAGDTSWITLGTYTQRAVMGSLLAPLPAFSADYTDYWHTLQVELLQADDLESLTREQLLREGNPAAIVFPDGSVELLQFQDATNIGGQRWNGTTLLRGRLTTTPGPHLSGATFVMLAGTVFVPLPTALIGKNLEFRVTSLGNSPEVAPVYSFTWSPAHCQREFAPQRLQLTRGGGTISGEWVARKRFGTDIVPIHSQSFRGYRVTLTDGVTTTVLPDTNDTQFSTSDAAFTGDITVTVQGVNLITGAGPGTSETI